MDKMNSSCFKNILITILLPICMNGVSLFDAFCVGIEKENEEFGVFLNASSYEEIGELATVRLGANPYYLYSETGPTNDISWDDDDNNILAQRTGKLAYHEYLVNDIIFVIKEQKEYKNQRKILNTFEPTEVYRIIGIRSEKFYIVMKNNLKSICNKLWSNKEYGPAGKTTWKAFILRKIEERKIKKGELEKSLMELNITTKLTPKHRFEQCFQDTTFILGPGKINSDVSSRKTLNLNGFEKNDTLLIDLIIKTGAINFKIAMPDSINNSWNYILNEEVNVKGSWIIRNPTVDGGFEIYLDNLDGYTDSEVKCKIVGIRWTYD